MRKTPRKIITSDSYAEVWFLSRTAGLDITDIETLPNGRIKVVYRTAEMADAALKRVLATVH